MWNETNRASIQIDRPLGSHHPEYSEMQYPVNYGYVPGVMAPDGEEQDAYLLGVGVPVQEYTGRHIATIHRENDCEDKWVICPPEQDFTAEEIRRATWFAEQYFDSAVEML